MAKKKSENNHNKTGLILMLVVIAVTIISLIIIISSKIDFQSTGKAGEFFPPADQTLGDYESQSTLSDFDTLIFELQSKGSPDPFYFIADPDIFPYTATSSSMAVTETFYRSELYYQLKFGQEPEPVVRDVLENGLGDASYTLYNPRSSTLNAGIEIIDLHGYNEFQGTYADLLLTPKLEVQLIPVLEAKLILPAEVKCTNTDNLRFDYPNWGEIKCSYKEHCYDLGSGQVVDTCIGKPCRLVEYWFNDNYEVNSVLVNCVNQGYTMCRSGKCI